jgi:D-amino peptidase
VTDRAAGLSTTFWRTGKSVRHYVMTDLEGCAGVWRWRQTREGDNPDNAAAKRLLTGEVNATVAGIFDADPQAEVLVHDGHGPGGLVFEALDPRVQYARRVSSVRLLAHGFDALYFVGQHAMAGTPEAPLCHTQSSLRVAEYRLNGQPIGEFGTMAALAAEFVSGDDKAVAEARAAVPEIVTVTTKVGHGLEAAVHLTHPASCRRHREAAARAVGCARTIAPYRIAPPYELRIEYLPGHDVGELLARGGVAAGPRAVVFHAARLADLPGIS